jgi:hypothetical protein
MDRPSRESSGAAADAATGIHFPYLRLDHFGLRRSIFETVRIELSIWVE